MYKINLLPDELFQPQTDLKRIMRFLLVTILVALISGSYVLFLYHSIQLEKELVRLQKKVADIQPELIRLESLRKEKTDLEKASADIEGLAGNRVAWSPVIAEINRNIPTDIWLTGFSFYYDRVSIQVTEPDPQKNQQQDKKAVNLEETARKIEGNIASQADKQSRMDGRQGQPATLPVPNALLIEGESKSVLPVSVFVNRMLKARYFRDVRINDIHENKERGTLVFGLTALVSGGER